MYSTLKCLFLFVTAVASTPFQTFDKRNACDWKDAEPVLYHEYGTDACPPRVALNEDGSCPVRSYKAGLFQPNGCAGFCEIRTTYSYGRESIFLDNPYCHGYGQKAATCSISDTQTTTTSLSFSIPASVKITDTLTFGITGGYTWTWSHAIAQTKSISLGEGECGYWTFLPIVKETCGSYSEGKHLDGCYKLPGGVTTVDNVCVSQGNKAPGSDKTPRGDTIFVRTDCGNRKPLPMDQQDPAYNHPGVPLPRDDYEAFAATFEDGIGALSGTSDITCETDDSSALADDCTKAMDSLPTFATQTVEPREKGGLSWPAYQLSCALQVEYPSDWADDCNVTLAEVLKAATGIQNQCTRGDKVGGVRQLRKDGKCDAFLRIAATDGRPVPRSGS